MLVQIVSRIASSCLDVHASFVFVDSFVAKSIAKNQKSTYVQLSNGQMCRLNLHSASLPPPRKNFNLRSMLKFATFNFGSLPSSSNRHSDSNFNSIVDFANYVTDD